MGRTACWLDGKPCSYGEPEGQFLLRPVQSCRVDVCQRLTVVLRTGEMDTIFETSLCPTCGGVCDVCATRERLNKQ